MVSISQKRADATTIARNSCSRNLNITQREVNNLNENWRFHGISIKKNFDFKRSLGGDIDHERSGSDNGLNMELSEIGHSSLICWNLMMKVTSHVGI